MSAAKFLKPMGATPIQVTKKRPKSVQIAATGAALPAGAHQLTDEQQRAWFGGVVFHQAVSWDGAQFVSGDLRLTPGQIRHRLRARN